MQDESDVGKPSEPSITIVEPIHHFDITLELSSDQSLHGRSTNVYLASTENLLSSANCFANSFLSLPNHIPEGVTFHVFSDASTTIKCECIHRGAQRRLFRTLSQHLSSITTLFGHPFLKCWWDAVMCHRTLWKHGVYHHDITPATLMYYQNEAGDDVGGLIDFGTATTP